MTTTADNQKLTRTRLLQMAGGAVLGATLSYTFITTLRLLGLNIKTWPWIDVAAFMEGSIFAFIGLISIAITLSPSLTAKQIDQTPDAPPATRRELSMGRLQGLILFLAGALLLTPLLASAHGANTANAPMLFAIIVLAFLGQSLLNYILWRRADELARIAITNTSSVSFWILQGLLFLAGSAQKLGLLSTFSLWTAMVLTLGVYSIASLVVSYRTCSR